MSYILIHIETKEGYFVTDIPCIANIIKISKNTIANWFADGNRYYKTTAFIIFKNPTIIKSKRNFPFERK
jgi:hypothetical protein